MSFVLFRNEKKNTAMSHPPPPQTPPQSRLQMILEVGRVQQMSRDDDVVAAHIHNNTIPRIHLAAAPPANPPAKSDNESTLGGDLVTCCAQCGHLLAGIAGACV